LPGRDDPLAFGEALERYDTYRSPRPGQTESEELGCSRFGEVSESVDYAR